MSRREHAGLLLALALGGLSVVLGTRIARHYQAGGALRLEVGRVHVTRLAPETVARLQGLRERVLVTYYVSRPERMPSSMRRVERQVTDLLRAMQARAPETFDYQIVDPETEPDLAGFAARRGVAPFRVRSVARDAWDERTVWSALTISYGARPDAHVRGIGPEHVPRLQATITAWLAELERPGRPRIALEAPSGFEELRAALAEHGTLVPVALEEGATLPDAELLVWMQPERVTPATLRDLERFLKEGGSVLLAGSTLVARQGSLVAVPEPETAARPALQLFQSGMPAELLLAPFGLRPAPDLLLDERCDSVAFEGQNVRAPFLVRSIAPNHDFRGFRDPPNGTLLFTAPTALVPVPDDLLRSGWSAQVLATSSDMTWMQAPPVSPRAPLFLDEMQPANGRAVAKQPLLVALRHEDPWRGTLVVSSATTPFEDGLFERSGTAHRRLLDTLVGELADAEQRVLRGAGLARAEPLPPLSPAGRAFWRGVCVFLVPAALVAAGWQRRRAAVTERRARARGELRRGIPAFVLGIACVLLATRVSSALGWRADATHDGLNRLAPETAAIARRAGERGPVRARLCFSEQARLPPRLRPEVARLKGLLRELERAGAELEVVRTRPEDLDEAERAALAVAGVLPHETTTRTEETASFRRYYASLILAREEREEVLAFPTAGSFESLEFRLAFALWRLEGRRAPRVAVASDVPRPSAAEAYELYQEKGLFAPKGTDVYSTARRVLEELDLDVTHVNPRAPELPADLDLLVWLQPRRSIEPMLGEAVRHLHGGGALLLAAQHFNVQARQYPGRDYEIVYWPQPQTPDVEELYFPELGIDLSRQVLFDERSTSMDSESQVVGRGGERSFERQSSALPFVVRTAAANYAPDSPVTRDLGDQAFPWPSPVRLDPERLAALGLEAEVLIRTSERTWTFDWQGGWLPPELLAGPPLDAAGEPELGGRESLAVLVTGSFPRPERPLRLQPAEDEAQLPAEAPWPAPGRGRLCLVGGSELFKNERIREPAFRADQLLANAATTLALAPELAAIATRRSVARGFGYVAPDARLAWRGLVVGAGPLAIALLAAVVAFVRARPPRRVL